MPIHPQLQQLLAAVPQIDFETISIEDLRVAAAAQVPAGAPGPELASTEDHQVPTPNGALSVRIHRPLGEGPKPTVVFFHGGGWSVGSPAIISPLTERLSAYLGAVVVSASYRLAPENRFPAAYEDAVFLTRWAAENVGELGGQPEAFAVAGESAGGNLAAAVALTLRGENLLAGQLLFNPATDLSAAARDTDSWRADADPALPVANTEWSIRSYLGTEASTDWRASPASAEDVTGAAPLVVGVSGNDPLRDDGRAYADKFTTAGVPTRVICFEDLVHAYAAQSFLVPVANDALIQTCEEFRTLMNWPAPADHQ